MSRHQTQALVLVAGLVAGFPDNGAAQGPAPIGQTVELLSHPGFSGPTAKVRGTLVLVTPDTATVRTPDGDRVVLLADLTGVKVRRMQRQTVAGATLGLTVGLLATGWDPESNPGVAIGSAAAGAALGWLVKLPAFKKAPVSELRPDPLPGTIVQIKLHGDAITGTFVEAGPDQVVIEIPDQGRLPIPRRDVTGIAWRSGKAGPSLVPPLLLAAVGLAVGLAATAPECSPDEWLCMNEFSEGAYAITGAGIGMGIGLAISLVLPRSWNWEKAPPPAPRLTVRPAPGGRFMVGVNHAIRFR
jgi:hypothetical protein